MIAKVSPAVFSADGTGKGTFAGQGGVPAPIVYTGAQGRFPGLAQLNVVLPLLNAPRDVVVTADAIASNTVTAAGLITIGGG